MFLLFFIVYFTILTCRFYNDIQAFKFESVSFQYVMNGIQSPYVYDSSPLTSFGVHKEDLDANSINYLHRGEPKVWYMIPLEDSDKLEKLAAQMSIEMNCDFYVRHKNITIPPSILHKNGINFTRVSNIFACIKEAHTSKAIQAKRSESE